MHPRKTLPVDFVILKDSRNYAIMDEAFAAWHPHSDSVFTSGKAAARLYSSITENLGILNGIITTSPLETIYTILCSGAPYGQCLSVCDELARLYGITAEDITHFMETKAYSWYHQLILFKSSHIDAHSENGGESLARARMILEGFEDPTLQIVIPNPLYDPNLPRSEAHRRHNTKTLRPDFLWLLDEEGKVVHEPVAVPLPEGYRCVIAEMDGFDKYHNTAMLSSSNARDSKDAWYQEKDRDVALQILGFTIIHFSYDDVTENNGKRLCDLLNLARIPHISTVEKKRRIHLAKKYGDFSILCSELRQKYLQSRNKHAT
ncbi:hypothetical protein [Alloscardovia macacae]|nr:hypothetical protein [Alloscardovia macacae]